MPWPQPYRADGPSPQNSPVGAGSRHGFPTARECDYRSGGRSAEWCERADGRVGSLCVVGHVHEHGVCSSLQGWICTVRQVVRGEFDKGTAGSEFFAGADRHVGQHCGRIHADIVSRRFLQNAGTFYPSNLNNSLTAGVAGSFARVMSFDYGIGITEQVAPNTYVSIWGQSNAEISGPTISGVWSGGFEYCENSGAGPRFYRCSPQPTAYCEAPNHRLTFVRR